MARYFGLGAITCMNMVDSILSEPFNNTNASLSGRRTRSAMACNSCRRLKIKCANVNREHCQRCKDKDIICEYSACTNTRSADTSPTPSTPTSSPSIRQANTGDAARSSGDQGILGVATSPIQVAQAGGPDTSSRVYIDNASLTVVQEGATSTDCPCDDPEAHGCVIPQTPVGELSRDMQALSREIAERYPTMPRLDY